MRKLLCVVLCVIMLCCMMVAPMQVGAAGGGNIFPEDIFSSAAKCGEFFVSADHEGNVYEGDGVLALPEHKGLDFMYTLAEVPYESYTVSFDFYLNIAEGAQVPDEMDFLFAVGNEGHQFHQITIGHSGGSLTLYHYSFNDAWTPYVDEETFFEIYDEEGWWTFSADVTPTEVDVFVNDQYVATLGNIESAAGGIGLRGGSTRGWKIKNLSLVEKTDDGMTTEEPTEEPTEELTDAPTETPEITGETTDDSIAPATPSAGAAENADADARDDDGSSAWIWIVAVAVAVVVIAAVVIAVILLKKKKNG